MHTFNYLFSRSSHFPPFALCVCSSVQHLLHFLCERSDQIKDNLMAKILNCKKGNIIFSCQFVD
jgi:hypothetical protein